MLDIAKTNFIVWCHPRSGSHNLMSRLRNTIRSLDLHVGNLYEMFPDHSALVGKGYHSEFSLKEVSQQNDNFTAGLSWELDSNGLLQSTYRKDWSYLDELERRLNTLEYDEIKCPTVGKHITWWNRFTENIKGKHETYIDRVHSAVAGIADRNIILYRQDLSNFAASMNVLDLSYIESGKRKNRISTHGDITIVNDDPAIKINTDRLDRYIDRLVAGFKYLDRQRTVMIATEELDQLDTITWPDGMSIALIEYGKQEFRSNYMREDSYGNISHVGQAIEVINDKTDIQEWAAKTDERHNWANIREIHGFSRGF